MTFRSVQTSLTVHSDAAKVHALESGEEFINIDGRLFQKVCADFVMLDVELIGVGAHYGQP